MNSVLLVVTVASLAATVAMAVLVFRLLRDDRQRSEARALLLGQLAGEQAIAAGADLRPRVAAAECADPDPNRPVLPGDMFATPAVESPWSSRLGIIGAMALLLCGALAVAVLTGRSQADTPVAADAATRPLELLSLVYTQEPGVLRIAGTVENPRGAQPLSEVVATAFVFDATGGFVASGRAPLDYTTLGAGDESPFVIRVPVTRPAARYRISFRTAGGRVVEHVDRRNGVPVARNE